MSSEWLVVVLVWGDRLVLRPEGTTACLIDIVHRDDIDRYGRT